MTKNAVNAVNESAVEQVVKTRKVNQAGVRLVEGEVVSSLEAKTIRLLIEGHKLKQVINEAEVRLSEINETLLDGYDTGCALVVAGICRATLISRSLVKIVDPVPLRVLLGARYGDLVREAMAYKPEPKLIAMAADGDDELGRKIGDCLVVTVGESVTWRAEK